MRLRKYTRRFWAYARAHGRTAPAQLRHDMRTSPGGCMASYIVWVMTRISEWRALRGHPVPLPMLDRDHADFDNWLRERNGAA